MPISKNDIKIISNDVLKIDHFDTYIMCEYCFPPSLYVPKKFQNKRKCNFTKGFYWLLWVVFCYKQLESVTETCYKSLVEENVCLNNSQLKLKVIFQFPIGLPWGKDLFLHKH